MLKQKQLIIAAAVIILLLLGLGGYLMFGKNTTPQQNQTSNTTSGEQTTNSAMNSLVNLITSGANVTCSFDMTGTDNEFSGKGTVYVSSGNMRGDFQTTVDGKVTNMSMIRKGNDNYIWGDQMESGIKMTISPDDLKTETNEANKYFDYNKQLDYKCNPWGADQSKFNPPSNVKFTDYSKMMEETTKIMKDNEGTGYDSSLCDSITDADAKAACQNAMNQ
ncbi:MAG: hypothetical protein HY344_00410 [Candidatus Levybacteria bacterium]|nr:hypothetical protein [Candidatus Levybacteria bacterium]